MEVCKILTDKGYEYNSTRGFDEKNAVMKSKIKTETFTLF